MYVTFQLYC